MASLNPAHKLKSLCGLANWRNCLISLICLWKRLKRESCECRITTVSLTVSSTKSIVNPSREIMVKRAGKIKHLVFRFMPQHVSLAVVNGNQQKRKGNSFSMMTREDETTRVKI
uniref:Uncharacterized protein n=1 Tax=Cacopsylla melanoneura TaxID=428564 RepID=A0A8D8SKC6_9HEMI